MLKVENYSVRNKIANKINKKMDFISLGKEKQEKIMYEDSYYHRSKHQLDGDSKFQRLVLCFTCYCSIFCFDHIKLTESQCQNMKESLKHSK